jgi:hypothetical protein
MNSMRYLTSMACAAAIMTLAAGCAQYTSSTPSAKMVPSRPRSILAGNADVATLNSLANDPTNSREERARAIFTIFARHLMPGVAAPDIGRVLPDKAWVQQTQLYTADLVNGWIPLAMTEDDTVFAVHLFPEAGEKRVSPWVLYIRLTGRFVQYEDAVAFLRGERGAWNPKLAEFALSFPHSSDPEKFPGRIEDYSASGLRVFEEPSIHILSAQSVTDGQ